MIYLDHAATTPVIHGAVQAMLPYFGERFGNPSSVHQYGREARAAVDRAREVVAESLNTSAAQIIFTSGGTEADNVAVSGVAWASRDAQKGNHLITSTVEHPAVLNTCKYLEKRGFEVTCIPVDKKGRVVLKQLEAAVREDTVLISVIYGNNEVGTLEPVEEIGRLARERGILFHTDAVQAYGVCPMDVGRLPVDLLTVSAHKVNGPKGVGALYVSPEVRMAPLLLGGSQERRHRGGTENVAGIIGFAEAVKWTMEKRVDNALFFRQCKEVLLDTLKEALGVDGFVVNGHAELTLPHILNVSFPGVDTETLLMRLDMAGIAASSGSACSAGALEPSHVLQAMGVEKEVLQSAVRFSFGYGNTLEEVVQAGKITAELVRKIRERRAVRPAY